MNDMHRLLKARKELMSFKSDTLSFTGVQPNSIAALAYVRLALANIQMAELCMAFTIPMPESVKKKLKELEEQGR